MLMGRQILGSFLAVIALSFPALGHNKTLFVDGPDAALYGEVLIDTASWREENISYPKLRAGVQVARFSLVGLTLGYQKAGFYEMVENWTQRGNSRRIDFHGPVVGLHIIPSENFNFSVIAAFSQGRLGREEKTQEAYTYPDCEPLSCEIRREESKLNLSEYQLQVSVPVWKTLEITLGAGQIQVEGRPRYETRAAGTRSPSSFVTYGAGDWEASEPFFSLGLRGSQL